MWEGGSKARTLAALVLLGIALGGCATSIADMPLIGNPADAPARPKDPGTYLPVHDLPTARDGATMEPAEQAKLQADLIAARDRQAVATPAAAAPAGKKPAAKQQQ
jgi:hypothetical protein